jgi:hypothetical protein
MPVYFIVKKRLFSQKSLFNKRSASALSISMCWMVRGTAPLSADVRPSLLSLAERGLGTTVLPQESAQFPSPSLRDFLVTELKGV